MYIDLSVTVNEQTPVYPGDAPVKVEPAGNIESDGFNDHVVSINTHVGTHIDAPLHMLANGITLEQIPIEQFIGRGRLVEASSIDYENLSQTDFQAGDIVLFHTGMSAHYNEPSYFKNYPIISEEVAHFLVERKVKMFGVDTGSVDIAEDFPIHKILLAGGVLIIENLTNLDKLIGKDFEVYALPIKLDIDGAPARVIAVSDEN